jgi:DNA-binding protein HU-beta
MPPQEIVMPPAKKAAPAAKKAAPAKAAPQATITLKHLAAALSDSHDLPKKQAEAVLRDLVTLTIRHLKKGDKIRLTGLGILQVRSGRPGWGGTRRPAKPSRSRRARRLPSGLRRN